MIGAVSAASDGDDAASGPDLTEKTIMQDSINTDIVEDNFKNYSEISEDKNLKSEEEYGPEIGADTPKNALKDSGISTVNNWGELKNAINDGAVIELSGDDVYYAEGSGISIDSGTVTINGKGHTIDAQRLNCRIFEINGATLTLENLILKNCNSTEEYGGAIYNDQGTLTLTNCTFTNNTAWGGNTNSKGGAIYNYEGTLKILDSTFNKNMAYNMAIYNYAEEDNPFRLTIINTTMIEDKICVNYEDNERRLDDKRDIDLLTTEVNAYIPELIYEGTAVLISVTGIDADFNGTVTVNITNTIYNTEVNVANGEGNITMNLDINKYTARFKNFISLTEEAFERDDTKPYLEINFKVITHNSFSALNDDINKSTDSISLSHDYIYDSKTDVDYLRGITISNGKTLTIYGNGHSIEGKNASRLFMIDENANVRMENITLKEGRAQRGSRFDLGGAIYLDGSNLTLINSTLKNNRASDGQGGGIYATAGSSLNIIESNFTDNIAIEGKSIFMVESERAYILNSLIDEKDIGNIGDDLLAQITVLNKLNAMLNIANYTQGNDALLNVTGPEDFTQIVNLTVNNSQSYDNIEITNGQAIINLGLEPGAYTATMTTPEFEYYADPNRNLTCTYLSTNITSNEFIVLKEANIQLTVENITYGETETVIADIDGAGNVTIKLNGETIKDCLDISDKKIEYAIPECLNAGNYTVEVIYNGDEYTLNSSRSANFTVNKANASFEIDFKSSIAFGETQNVTIRFDNPNATGKMTISIDDENYTANVTGSVAKFTTPALPAETYEITFAYSGDKNINDGQKRETMTITKVNSTLTVNDIEFKYNSTGSTVVSFTGAENLSAEVINQPNAIVDVNGTAITISGLDAGNYTLAVTTNPDKNHYAVTENAQIKVSKAASEVKIDVNANYNIGEAFNITISNNTASSVTINGKPYDIKNGKVDIDTTSLKADNYTVIANIDENNNFLASSDTARFTISKLTAPQIVIDVESSAVDAGALDVNVTVGDATGIVNINGENLTLENGKASTTLKNVNVSDLTIEVIYFGSDKYLNNSAKVNLHIKPVKVEKIIYVNQTVEVPVEVEKIIYLNNTVEVEKIVYINQTVEVPVEVEKIVYVNSTNDIPIETEKIVYINQTVEVPVEVEKIVYVNNTVEVPVYINNTVEKNNTVYVTPNRTTTKIEYKNMVTTAVAKADGRVGEYFYVRLTDDKGKALADKPIKIGFNGVVYNRTTDANGSAKLQINLGYEGIYTFAIGFLGDDNYTGAFEVASITVKAQAPKLTASEKSYKANAKTKALTATFKTVKGNPVSGKKISFTIGGKTYTGTTNAKGVATVKISLNKKGTYSATAKYDGDGMFKATSTKFKVKIV